MPSFLITFCTEVQIYAKEGLFLVTIICDLQSPFGSCNFGGNDRWLQLHSNLNGYFGALNTDVPFTFQGTICDDCLMMTFCGYCAMCQMSREMTRAGIPPSGCV